VNSLGRVRPLVTSDLARVVQIERETFSDPWSRASFATSLREPHVRALGLVNGAAELVGYGLATVIADEGEILNLAVARERRGKGYGRLILDALLKALWAEGVEKAYLEVRRSNEPAIALYRAAGFQPLGVRPGYYAIPREDALTMALELGSQTAKEG
jgi:ribosomal-protein-alanine N-acetyltransferase